MWEITKITISQNTKKTYCKLNEQLVIQVRKPNLISSRDTEGENSTDTDTKSSKTDNQIRSTALEWSVTFVRKSIYCILLGALYQLSLRYFLRSMLLLLLQWDLTTPPHFKVYRARLVNILTTLFPSRPPRGS